ncbi:calcium/calmodulin-dependent protein kinase type II delta chain-like [Oculina patagonica]
MLSAGLRLVKKLFSWSLNYYRQGVTSLCVRPFVTKKEGLDEEKMPQSEDKQNVDVEAHKAREQHIIDLNQKLLTSITDGDYETYRKLVDSHVTSFEPVSPGQLVEGLEFHKFYFDNVISKRTTPVNTTIFSQRVHMLGDDAACICYVRLRQFVNSAGIASEQQSEETRVWHKRSGRWVMVHLHSTYV